MHSFVLVTIPWTICTSLLSLYVHSYKEQYIMNISEQKAIRAFCFECLSDRIHYGEGCEMTFSWNGGRRLWRGVLINIWHRVLFFSWALIPPPECDAHLCRCRRHENPSSCSQFKVHCHSWQLMAILLRQKEYHLWFKTARRWMRANNRDARETR